MTEQEILQEFTQKMNDVMSGHIYEPGHSEAVITSVAQSIVPMGFKVVGAEYKNGKLDVLLGPVDPWYQVDFSIDTKTGEVTFPAKKKQCKRTSKN